jgi:hypothetical protein
MYRLLYILFIVLMTFLSSAAQPDWELTEVVDVPDFEFSFRYPTGYTLMSAEDGYLLPPGFEPIPNATAFMEDPTEIERAYLMLERESDLENATDASWDTATQGIVLALYVSPLADWRVDETMTIDAISRVVCDILGMSSFYRMPIAVMGRTSAVCNGILMSTDRTGSYTMWTDDGSLFVLAVELPIGVQSILDEDIYASSLIATFESTPVAPLSRDIDMGDSGYMFRVPEGWEVETTPFGLEIREPALDGMIVSFSTLSEADMRANNALLETTDDAIGFMMSAFDFEEPTFAEVMIGGELTLEISGRDPEFETYVRVAPYILDSDMLAFLQFARDAESLERYEATFHAILASVRPIMETAD